MEWNSLLATFGALAGVAAAVTALVNIGKSIGLVKDGTAGAWSTGINLLGLVFLYINDVAGFGIDVAEVDALLATFAQVSVAVVAFIMQLVESKVFHKALSWVKAPFIGKSFSD